MIDSKELSIQDKSDIENNIKKYIDMFCDEMNISSIQETSQSIFNGMLMYISKNYIQPSELVYIPSKHLYKIDNICFISDYLIYLCRIYDKECTIYSLSYLTNINESVFYEWWNDYRKYGYEDEKATNKIREVYKKYHKERERTLSDKLLTGKNPVGVLGILNHFYGWAGTGNMVEDKEKQSASLADLRGKLTDNSPGAAAMIGADSDKQL